MGEKSPNFSAKPRRWRRKIAIAVCSSVLALVAAEIGLALFDIAPPDPHGQVGQKPNRPSHDFVADARIGWRMRPGHAFTWETGGRRVRYHANRLGFRDDPARTPRGAHHTLAIVGDSVSWGFGVTFEESFGGILARELPDCRVSNFAMPGFGLDQIWQSLRHHALPSHPELVIIGIVRDDFRRSLFAYRRTEGFNKPTFTLSGGALRRLGPSDRPGWLGRALEEHSRLWTAGWKMLERIGHRYRIGPWWTLNAAILDAMRADAKAARTRLLFVHLPEPGEGVFPSLQRHLREVGAAYVEPEDRKPTESGTLYFKDRHLNAAGHRWIARCLLAWLREHTTLARPR